MTYFRNDGWVKSVLGQAIAGAQVYVCNQPADVSYVPPEPLASIFSDPAGLSPVTQPLYTDGFGHYDFYVAYGTYTVVVVTGGKIQQVYPDQTIGFSNSGGGAVSSVFGRTGDVVAESGDYDISQITGAVTSVFGRTGAVVAQSGDYSVSDITGAAPLASPAFTGIPTAPTASLGTNTTQLATCEFVLANAGGGTVSSVFGRTGAVVAQSGDYAVADITGAAPLASPALTGVPTAPTASLGTSTTQIATCEFVLDNAGGGNTFPLTFVQYYAFQSGNSNSTTYTVTFPQAAAASGNTLFMLIGTDGSSAFTPPAGWTVDIDQPQTLYSRFVLMHKTSAADTSALLTIGTASTFSGFFFEVSGAHALDQSSSSGVADQQFLALPSITPTAGSAVFGVFAYTSDTSGTLNNYGQFTPPMLHPMWKMASIQASSSNAGRGIVVAMYLGTATSSAIAPPYLTFPGMALYSGAGLAYSTFSIL